MDALLLMRQLYFYIDKVVTGTANSSPNAVVE